MTAAYACTRKQFNKNLSEFGLIQVPKAVGGAACVDDMCGHRRCASVACSGDSCCDSEEDKIRLYLMWLPAGKAGLGAVGIEPPDFIFFSVGWHIWVSPHADCFLIVFFPEHPRRSLP